MIYITGDIHTDPLRFHPKKWAEKGLPPLTSADYVIICGDFGIPWGRFPREDGPVLQGRPISWYDKKALQKLERLPATFLFVDGNHENFDLLSHMEVRSWHGGNVHVLQENVLHLMRGEIFTIEGKVFFVMGGAMSIDKVCRKEGVSWWPQEVPNETEQWHALENLQAFQAEGGHIDYVLTHTCPRVLIRLMFHVEPIEDDTTKFLDVINNRLGDEITGWYFGHWHENKDAWQYHALYDRVVVLK